MIKIAHIDDDHNFGFLFWTMVQAYNATATKDEDMIVLDSYRDGKHFWEAFMNDAQEYDLVVLDIQLETFASLIAKDDIKIRDIVRRFKMLSRDANHRNMTDVLLRSEDYSNHIAHA